MRTTLYLLVGLLVAFVVGVAYVNWPSSVMAAPAPEIPVQPLSDGPDNWLMLAAVVFCWVTAFLPLPRWLAVLLGLAIVWLGLAVMAVTGFFVYLQYPNNTLSDGAYTGFLCSIGMVSSRILSVLGHAYREGG